MVTDERMKDVIITAKRQDGCLHATR